MARPVNNPKYEGSEKSLMGMLGYPKEAHEKAKKEAETLHNSNPRTPEIQAHNAKLEKQAERLPKSPRKVPPYGKGHDMVQHGEGKPFPAPEPVGDIESR